MARGLAEGLLAGYNTASTAIDREKRLGLAEAQFDYTKQVDERNFDYTKEKDNRNFILQEEAMRIRQQQFELDKQSHKSALNLQNIQTQKYQFQLDNEKRQQRFQDEFLYVKAYHDLRGKNVDDPRLEHLLSQISRDHPAHPSRFDENFFKTIEKGNVVIPEVLNNQRDLNDKDVIEVGNTILSPYIKRNIGEVDKAIGKKIVDKNLARLDLTDDGQRLVPGLKVDYEDGTSAIKPMTEFGSSDPNDKFIVQLTQQRFFEEYRGLAVLSAHAEQERRKQAEVELYRQQQKRGEEQYKLRQEEQQRLLQQQEEQQKEQKLRQQQTSTWINRNYFGTGESPKNLENYQSAILDVEKEAFKAMNALEAAGVYNSEEMETAKQRISLTAEARKIEIAKLFGYFKEQPKQEVDAERAEFFAQLSKDLGAETVKTMSKEELDKRFEASQQKKQQKKQGGSLKQAIIERQNSTTPQAQGTASSKGSLMDVYRQDLAKKALNYF